MDAVTINACDEMIREYTRDYMEKVFYFCLKKTGSADEAEDLCSDISLAVISALKKGTDVKHFAAWVWQIAKNRYRVWAVSKHRSMELYDRDAETDSVPDDTMGVEDGVILDEDLKLLRRELAFISSDYRDVVVKFYIDDLSVKAIASALSLPEGTVKTKLFRARNILKEGMNMAREFGPKSYKPENVSFIAGGSQPTGLPWTQVQRRVQKNILLEAANNPSTIEELSMALGIAAPYMEDEVGTLTWATLLKKVGERYVTNFPFISAEIQRKAAAIRRGYLDEYADIVDKIATDMVQKVREMGAVRNGKLTDDEIKWWAVLFTSEMAYSFNICENIEQPPARANGETWSFIGYEDSGEQRELVSHNGGGVDGCLDFYVPHNYPIACKWCDLSRYNNADILVDALKSSKKKEDLTRAELNSLGWIDPLYHFEEDGTITPDILTFEIHKGVENEYPDFHLINHPLYEKLSEIMKKIYEDITKLFNDSSNVYVPEQLGNVAASESIMNGETVKKLVDTGRLVLPEDAENSVCTASLYILHGFY